MPARSNECAPTDFTCPLMDTSPEGFVQTVARLSEAVRHLSGCTEKIQKDVDDNREHVDIEAARTRDIAYRARNLSWKALLLASGALCVASAGITWFMMHLTK